MKEQKMKTIAEQLSTYKSVHLNQKNIQTHFIGIPLIIWSVALLLTSLSYNIVLAEFSLNVTLTAVIAIGVLIYYCLLSLPLALLAFPLFGGLIFSAITMAGVEHKYFIAIAAFIAGWVIQFIGHGFEKAKPAFVDDLNQLSIGPLFLIAEIYFLLGFGKTLNQKITAMAIDKRKSFEQAKRAG